MIVLALFPLAHAEIACDGPTPEQAAMTLDAAKERYRSARSVAVDTEWQYRLAIEDRDTVMAERKVALVELRDARANLTGAKHDTKMADTRVARCGPTASPSASVGAGSTSTAP